MLKNHALKGTDRVHRGILKTFLSPLEVVQLYVISLEVVQFCVILPLAGRSDAVATGEGLSRCPSGLRSSLVPRDPPKGKVNCISLEFIMN